MRQQFEGRENVTVPEAHDVAPIMETYEGERIPTTDEVDRAWVDVMRGRFDKKSDRYDATQREYSERVGSVADRLEQTIAEEAAHNEWFRGARVFRGSEYDDFKHGADVVLVFPEMRVDGSPLVVSLDVICDSRKYDVKLDVGAEVVDMRNMGTQEGVVKKMYRNVCKMLGKKAIDFDGSQVVMSPTVKYLPDELQKGYDGIAVPVVVGLDGKTADEIEEKNLSKDVREVMVREIQKQLFMYSVIAEKTDNSLVQKIQRRAEAAQKVFDQLAAEGKGPSRALENDAVAKRIHEDVLRTMPAFRADWAEVLKALQKKRG